MGNTVLQGVFISAIAIMITALIAPAFYTSDKKANKLLSRYVVPLDSANDSSLALSVTHIENILKQPHIQPGNIALVAFGKGIELFQVGNAYQVRLQNLIEKGVQMYVCEASMQPMNKAQRQPVVLTDGVHKVPNGKQYLDELMEQGYINSFA